MKVAAELARVREEASEAMAELDEARKRGARAEQLHKAEKMTAMAELSRVRHEAREAGGTMHPGETRGTRHNAPG